MSKPQLNASQLKYLVNLLWHNRVNGNSYHNREVKKAVYLMDDCKRKDFEKNESDLFDIFIRGGE